MTVEELKKVLKGDRIPFMILAGEEEYLKRYYLSSIRGRLVSDEGLAPFNHIRFEGNEIDFGRLSDALKTPPVFAEEKLVEWHLCDCDKMKADDLQKLRELCEEQDSFEGVTLVFYAEEGKLQFGNYPKRPSSRYTALSEFIDIVWFPPSTDAQLINWILRHFEKEKLLCAKATAEALLARVGHDVIHGAGQIQHISLADQGIHVTDHLADVELALVDGGHAGAHVTVVGLLLPEHFQQNGCGLAIS